MKIVFWVNIFCLGLLAMACSKKVTITGKVVRESGNQMPSPDLPISEPKGFITTVGFVEPFKAKDPFIYPRKQVKEIAVIQTNDEGFFKIRLSPGEYSVLIAKDSVSYFGNITDGEGYVNRWSFKKGKNYTLRLKANWDATY